MKSRVETHQKQRTFALDRRCARHGLGLSREQLKLHADSTVRLAIDPLGKRQWHQHHARVQLLGGGGKDGALRQLTRLHSSAELKLPLEDGQLLRALHADHV